MKKNKVKLEVKGSKCFKKRAGMPWSPCTENRPQRSPLGSLDVCRSSSSRFRRLRLPAVVGREASLSPDSSCCRGLGTLKMLINFYSRGSSWSPLWKNNIITFPHAIKGETLQADGLVKQKGA